MHKLVCLPNGLCSSPKKVTKLLKPALVYLREQGFASAYIDDLILSMNHIKPASEQRLKL